LSVDAADAVTGRTSHALDALNFFLADVRDGLGPYLSIYLLLTHGTGRFNVSLGALSTMWGVGAALSNVIAGWIVVAAGYDAAFISLGVVAAAGLTLYWAAGPETGHNAAAKGGETHARGPPPNGGGEPLANVTGA
jgi:hypothetical protein